MRWNSSDLNPDAPDVILPRPRGGMRATPCRSRSEMESPVRHRGSLNDTRNREVDRRALSHRALGPDAPVMGLGNPFRDRETQSGSGP